MRLCPSCNSPADSDDYFIYCHRCKQTSLVPQKTQNVLSERGTSEWVFNSSNDSLIKIIAGEFSQGYDYDSREEYFNLSTQFGIKVYTNEYNDDNEMESCAQYWKNEHFSKEDLEDIQDWLNSALEVEFDSAEAFVKAFDNFISDYSLE